MPRRRPTLCIDDYDCIGFDLDHTLCRYNVGNLVRLVYELLSDYLVTKKGYDISIKNHSLDADLNLVAKGLTLDFERGNLLRLGCDGTVLAATHGTKKLTDHEIERVYGRCRRKHPGSDYIQHLNEFGPQKMIEFSPVLHSFMDYFDLAAPLLCARIVDVIDNINNKGRPMDMYYFWPDVQEGLKELYLRTHFAADQGGFFPAVKANPELYILKRKPEFRSWLTMLRENGKFLYVITGSHVDFASHVASYAIGEDWKDLFDIVIFFARKPSFFVEKRPFWRLDGPVEVESFNGWEDLETGEYFSQGNWQDLNEFFEYCTEWEPSTSLYFGDNVLQDILAPKKFTATIDSIAVSEEMLAEGVVNNDTLTHPDMELLKSNLWGSYFYCHRDRDSGQSKVAASLRKLSSSTTPGSIVTTSNEEMKRAMSLRRVSSMRTPSDIMEAANAIANASNNSPTSSGSGSGSGVSGTPGASSSVTVSATVRVGRGWTPSGDDCDHKQLAQVHQEQPPQPLVRGQERINTLWGSLIRDYARMCIPDLEVLVDYPIDYRFPAFGRDKHGRLVGSGFFPGDPKPLHSDFNSSSSSAHAGDVKK